MENQLVDITTGGRLMEKATEYNFADKVATGTVLVDYWAVWCGPCRMVAPVLEKIEAEHGLPVIKVNVDEEPELARNARIMSIPTMVLYKDGQPVRTIVGAKSKNVLEKEFNLV
jgi:thioredoxin 1